MDGLSARLRRLGETVAGASDHSDQRSTLVEARRRWLTPAPSRPKRRALFYAVAAALCMFLAVILSRRHSTAAPVSFEIGTPPVPGVIGQWVAADHETPLPVRFSEGTQLTLAPGARMRVTQTTASGADVLLERGVLHAAVRHASSDTHWAVQAGPFEVRVTGTMFDADWNAATETFTLSMTEGSVVVRGPLLAPEHVVVGGQRLIVAVRDNRMELTAAATEQDAPPTPAVPSAGETAEAPPSPSAASASLPSPAAPPIDPTEMDWKALVRAGKYKDAMDVAERRGFNAEVDRASADELLALSDAARFAGRPARAREALLAQRRRFGARGRSAYLLGKIAADQEGKASEGATWFDTYLQEEPGGPLAEQALGRLLEIRKADAEAARPLAQRYLASYPNGAYASLARSLVSP